MPHQRLILRKCRDCGLEAHTEEDLEQFVKRKEMKYRRRNLCKPCFNSYFLNHLKTISSMYLKRKLVAMKNRTYGIKQVSVNQEWLDDPNKFVKWALENGWEQGLDIDRIDNDGNYTPDNCRFVSRQINLMNKSTTRTNLETQTRICNICNIEKHLTGFSPQTYKCRPCAREYSRKRRNKNAH